MDERNPYYHPEAFGLEILSFDEPDMCYEYNTLCFWKTNDGRIFTASDSGCSCPTPFENYEGANVDEVLQKLERVGSVEQALSTFNSWNNGKDWNDKDKTHLPVSYRDTLEAWVRSNLKA